MVIPYKQNLCVRCDGIGSIVSMLWLGGLPRHEPKRYDTCFNSIYVLVLFNVSFGLISPDEHTDCYETEYKIHIVLIIYS